MKAFASNENLVLDYRASALLALLLQQAERKREGREGRVCISPETVGRSKPLVKLRLRSCWANDVTEAGDVSVSLDGEF